MFYLHYAENGSILSVGNSVDNNLKHIVIDEKTFLDFWISTIAGGLAGKVVLT